MTFQADCLSGLHYNDERQDWNSTSRQKTLAAAATPESVVGRNEKSHPALAGWDLWVSA
jgi:hypothetical protein